MDWSVHGEEFQELELEGRVSRPDGHEIPME
jgi:hypothetical protein